MKAKGWTRNALVVADVRELAVNDVQNLVGVVEYNRIKQKDPHPTFLLLDIAKEGVSTGSLNIGGRWTKVAKRWFTSAIRELASKLNPTAEKPPADIYEGHEGVRGDGTSPPGRTPIGKTLRAWTEKVGSKVHAMALAYISHPEAKEKVRKGLFNICSIEASLRLLRTAEEWVIRKVEDATGIALADRADADPGFKSACVLGVIQELEVTGAVAEFEEDLDLSGGEGGGPGAGGGTPAGGTQRKPVRQDREDRVMPEQLTLRDVRDAVDKHGWRPEQLFELEALLASPKVVDAVDNEVTEKLTDEKAKWDTEKGQFASKAKEQEGEVKKLNDQLQPLLRKEGQQSIRELVLKSPQLKDEPKKKVEFLANRVPQLVDPATPEAEQTTKVEASIKKELESITTYGIKFDEEKPPENETPEEKAAREKKERESETPEEKAAREKKEKEEGGEKKDKGNLSDPKNNPWIP